MTTEKQIEDFLAQKRLAVVGVSRVPLETRRRVRLHWPRSARVAAVPLQRHPVTEINQ